MVPSRSVSNTREKLDDLRLQEEVRDIDLRTGVVFPAEFDFTDNLGTGNDDRPAITNRQLLDPTEIDALHHFD